MPGLTAPFRLDGISPGLNIIHGPNASGKTMTARAISALLWPRVVAADSISLGGHFTLAGAEWLVDLDLGRLRYLHDGSESSPPPLPPPEARDRYHLSLHDLLSSDNSDLARQILRESAGGYDLAEAAKLLETRTSPSQARRESGALRDARRNLNEARDRHEVLRREAEQLDELHLRAKRAEKAAARLELLDLAIQYAESVAAVELARRGVADYPEGMARLLGDEVERLAEIRERLADVRGRFDRAELRCNEAEKRLRQGAGIPVSHSELDLVLPALRHWIEAVRGYDHSLERAEVVLGRGIARRAEMLRAIGPGIDESRLRLIDTPALDELASYAREAGLAQAEVAALNALLDVFSAGGGAKHLEELIEGETVLRRWIRAGSTLSSRERGLRAYLFAAALALTIVGIAAGLSHPAFFSSTLVGAVLVVLALRPGDATDPRAVYRAEYDRLGVEPPAAWTEEEVESCLDRLRESIALGRMAEEAARRQHDVAIRVGLAEAELEPFERRRLELVRQFGVAPSSDAASTYWLAERIGRWQDADAEVSASVAEVETIGRRRGEELAATTAVLAGFGYETPLALADLIAATAEIEKRIGSHQEALRDLEQGRRECAELRHEIEMLMRDEAKVLGRFGSDADEARVARWSADHESYARAREALASAEDRCRDAAARLEMAAGTELELMGSDLRDLVAQRREAAAIAEEIGEIRSKIGGLEARLGDAYERHDSELAIAAVDRAHAALVDLRAADVTAMVGATLVDFLQKATRDQQRPAVFHSARELFARITRGRYRLDFDGGEPPAFRAFDNTAGTSHTLDELSSATRVQLLLAVRIAFIEELEHGARLPLVFDEALGNSDDQRAAAIIDAACALAAEGRQIFYFTAQPDEVAKWRAVLVEYPDLPAVFTDLADLRRLARYKEMPRPEITPEFRSVPAPNGMSHHEYGNELLVPPIDPAAGLGAIHLWHLIEEPEELYGLLRLGIESWGALHFLIQQNVRGVEGIDDGLIDRVATAATALETALDLLAIGRGRPVDREALRASGAVTEIFIDRVDDLCRECGRDAARLIDALEDLPRFRVDNRESLREYLEDNGYLDLRERIAPALIRLHAVDAVSREISAGLITLEQIDRLLARVEIPVGIV
jgi:hypothetical protein